MNGATPPLPYAFTTCTGTMLLNIKSRNTATCRSQWPRGLRRRSAAARLLISWVRIPPGAWIFVCCECCVLSGRGICDKLITRPLESYRLWCVVVCDLENLKNEEAMTRVGSQRYRKKKILLPTRVMTSNRKGAILNDKFARVRS